MPDVEMVPCRINGNWDLILPRHRAERAEWHTDAGWERERLDSMHAHLEPGMTIIDVGAEEGDFPGLWASWGCRVALIEPKAETWSNIRAVWDGNRFLPPRAMFVGFASDVTDLHPADPYLPATGYHLGSGWPACAYGEVIADHGFAHLSEQADSIPQTTLDDFAARSGFVVDAVTIDVEGSELRVLHGAARILTVYRPHVWVSVHADRPWMEAQYSGVDVGDVTRLMESHGYRCEVLAEDHELHLYCAPT